VWDLIDDFELRDGRKRTNDTEDRQPKETGEEAEADQCSFFRTQKKENLALFRARKRHSEKLFTFFPLVFLLPGRSLLSNI
jgi:hypothetical protein